MTPTIVTIREGVQFTPDAAAAFRRADAQVFAEFGRHIDVNSTYRSWDTQMGMYDAWNWYIHGGPYPGHSKAVHPSESFHVDGLALDSDDWVHDRIVQILAENGFIRNRLYVPGENHHFEYNRSRDKNYGRPASGGNAAPAPTPAPPEEEDDDMPKNTTQWYKKPKENTYVYIGYNTGSGFFHAFGNGAGRGTMPGTYTKNFMDTLDSAGWSEITEAHARVIDAACAEVRGVEVSGEIKVTVVSQAELDALES